MNQPPVTPGPSGPPFGPPSGPSGPPFGPPSTPPPGFPGGAPTGPPPGFPGAPPSPPAGPRKSRKGLIIGLCVGAVVLVVGAIAAVALIFFRGDGSTIPAFAVGDCASGLPDDAVKAPCDSPNATYRVINVVKTKAECGKEDGKFALSDERVYCADANMLVGHCYDDSTKWLLPSPDCAGYAFRVITIIPGDHTDDCASVPGANNWIRSRGAPFTTYCGWRKPVS
ncbi:hypothetical protein HUN08_06975 [Gordonia sp. X0973]|uniref:hypothetical protein n=1 Tax=Gordonia sp. X0973 TaxID=2742602 RepID=UPI0010AF6AF2|nr:hypothetical protein [Gordonia sp. X0973]QKT06961.1 hypothetical protein HUN08_06975 [Gordonia sp. X0973]